jgi:hypothetical protein
MEQPDNESLKRVTEIDDFYSVSGFRDLVLHVQEHRFTIPQIAEALESLALEFVGFYVQPNVAENYRKRFPDDPARTCLDHWAEFELENRKTFINTYNFWLRKSAGASGRVRPHGLSAVEGGAENHRNVVRGERTS